MLPQPSQHWKGYSSDLRDVEGPVRALDSSGCCILRYWQNGLEVLLQDDFASMEGQAEEFDRRGGCGWIELYCNMGPWKGKKEERKRRDVVPFNHTKAFQRSSWKGTRDIRNPLSESAMSGQSPATSGKSARNKIRQVSPEMGVPPSESGSGAKPHPDLG